MATVVKCPDGRLMAEVTRSEACAKCGACAHGQEEKRLYELPEGAFEVGDSVEIRLPDRSALPAALLGYGMPLLSMLIFLVIGFALGLPELYQALCALLGAALGYFVLKLLEPKLKKSGKFGYRVCKEDK